MKKQPISHLLAGAVIAGILILYSIFLLLSEQMANQKLSWFSYLMMVLALVYFVREHGKVNNHQLEFGQLFSYGFKATAFATILMLTFQVFFNMIFPEMKDKFIEIALEQMSADPRVTEEAMDVGIEIIKKTFWPLLIAGTLFGTMVVGLIGSLIGAAVSKKNPTTPFESLK
jgi:hypothetical protein